MKKVISILILLFVVGFSFADTTVDAVVNVGASDSTTTLTTTPAATKVSWDLTSVYDGDFGFYNIDQEDQEDPEVPLTIVIPESSGVVFGRGQVVIKWDILSSQALKMTIYPEKALTDTSNTNNKINWAIAISDEKPEPATAALDTAGVYGEDIAAEVFTESKDNFTLGNRTGKKYINIFTEDVRDNIPGNYSANLVLKIEPAESAQVGG